MKNLVYIAILTTVAVFSWIGFSIYHGYTTSTISADTGIAISPITATFDDATIQQLESRTTVAADLSQKMTNVQLTPAPLEVPNVASGSAEPASPSATPLENSTQSAQIKL